MRKVVGKVFRKHLLQFLVEKVVLGDSKDALFVEQLGIEVAQLAKQNFVFMLDIVRIAGHHEEEQGVTLDVSQEAKPKSTSFGGSLDDARNVGHDEGLPVAIGDDAERGFHCREGIAGYLRPGAGECAEECALACIGESHKAYVGQELQFEDDGPFQHRFAGLCVAWRLVGGSGKVLVAHAAASALEEHHDLAVCGNVADVLACLCIVNHRSARDVDVSVFTVGPRTAVGSAIASVTGKHVPFVAQVQECPVVVVAAQVDVSTASAVTAIRSTHRDVLGAMHVHGASAAFTRTATYLDVIYEIAFCHVWGLEVRGEPPSSYLTVSRNLKMDAIISSLLGVSAQRNVWRMPSFSNHSMRGAVWF